MKKSVSGNSGRRSPQRGQEAFCNPFETNWEVGIDAALLLWFQSWDAAAADDRAQKQRAQRLTKVECPLVQNTLQPEPAESAGGEAAPLNPHQSPPNFPLSSPTFYLPSTSIMRFSFIYPIAATVLLAATAAALPDHSPICDTNNAAAMISASPMGPTNMENLAKDNKYMWSTDKQTFNGGDTITVMLQGSDKFCGILLYATTASDPSKRLGSFAIPSGFQNDKMACSAFTLDSDDSVITHTMGQKYDGNQMFTYTAPSSISEDLVFHAIIMQKRATGGFAWGIYDSATVVHFGGSGSMSSSSSSSSSSTYSGMSTGGYSDMSMGGSCDCSKRIIRKCVPKRRGGSSGSNGSSGRNGSRKGRGRKGKKLDSTTTTDSSSDMTMTYASSARAAARPADQATAPTSPSANDRALSLASSEQLVFIFYLSCARLSLLVSILDFSSLWHWLAVGTGVLEPPLTPVSNDAAEVENHDDGRCPRSRRHSLATALTRVEQDFKQLPNNFASYSRQETPMFFHSEVGRLGDGKRPFSRVAALEFWVSLSPHFRASYRDCSPVLDAANALLQKRQKAPSPTKYIYG
ncbi:hypothetical protein BDK51DRAFT_49931 [Blyttiomyces helicus]|uniref:Reelin domain-containing protein n=1 Tax=Blyttiomyces helicus TaxID=388810 RepID=A0A4P9W8X9_9FUNG|nr:hypothetical protein BDK51DRAFT_49931 [Blyttiomyces helicus]|eukprot:RKO87935.1 hypothetical protein BDK51DRAFT_49931 [Blyttiomyces helicus]